MVHSPIVVYFPYITHCFDAQTWKTCCGEEADRRAKQTNHKLKRREWENTFTPRCTGGSWRPGWVLPQENCSDRKVSKNTGYKGTELCHTLKLQILSEFDVLFCFRSASCSASRTILQVSQYFVVRIPTFTQLIFIESVWILTWSLFCDHNRDANGQTPLHYAALQGSRTAIELFLESKPECLNYTDEDRVSGTILLLHN